MPIYKRGGMSGQTDVLQGTLDLLELHGNSQRLDLSQPARNRYQHGWPG